MKIKTEPVIKHTVSVEKLTHFNCGHCKKWWSIGDAPKRKKWFCPYCGILSSYGTK
ncbi:MAG: hypothetical protein WCQ32_01215 [bacterium]